MLAISEIDLHTAQGRKIPNFRTFDSSGSEQFLVHEHQQRYNLLKVRTGPTCMYNCHGLTFASRRTNIPEKHTIQQILDDDSYELVTISAVCPGDIVIYFNSNEEPDHSGIVVEISKDKPAIIVSKWGFAGEYIHYVNQSPYGINVRYYRVNYDKTQDLIQQLIRI